MKEVYKDPIFYYVVVPAVLLLWPVSIGFVYLPAAKEGLAADVVKYIEAQKLIGKILEMEPDRLDYLKTKKGGKKEFDYGRAVYSVARSSGIPSSEYELSSRPKRSYRGGQLVQSCHVDLKDVSIREFAEFLSKLQFRWPNLQCEKVAISKRGSQPDVWQIKLDLKYYY